MDEILMLHGTERECCDCHQTTIFIPVAPGEWCCTSCDAAFTLTLAA